VKHTIQQIGDISIVRIEEQRATVLQGTDALKKTLLDMVEEGKTRIIIDLSVVEFADSSTLGVLVSVLKAATRKSGDVKVFGLQPAVVAVFELTRLSRVFEVFGAESDALASFKVN
jgi:anti-sigma B factor antagonist